MYDIVNIQCHEQHFFLGFIKLLEVKYFEGFVIACIYIYIWLVNSRNIVLFVIADTLGVANVDKLWRADMIKAQKS